MLELLITFFGLGLFTFGGGYAMIPLLKDVVINKKHWMTDDEVLEMIAIAESTPGPIAINMATYIGYKQKGVLGSIFATLGVVLPSLTIIFIISLFFNAFMSNTFIQYAFTGIKCGVAILITMTGIDMLIKCKKNIINIVLFLLSFIAMIVIDIFAVNLSAILLIIVGGITGIVAYTISYKLIKNDKLADTIVGDAKDAVIEDEESLDETNNNEIEETITLESEDTKITKKSKANTKPKSHTKTITTETEGDTTITTTKTYDDGNLDTIEYKLKTKPKKKTTTSTKKKSGAKKTTSKKRSTKSTKKEEVK